MGSTSGGMVVFLFFKVVVSVELPLDAQSQNDAVVSLQGFLTLVGGARVPHLTANQQYIEWIVLICLYLVC